MRVQRGRLTLESDGADRVALVLGDDRHALELDTLRWLALVAAPVFLATPGIDPSRRPDRVADPDQQALELGA